MNFTAPFFAWAAVGVALATVALHLLAWRRPPESPLPTARFAPEQPIRMVSRAVRPADLGLLALRVLLVLLVGLALAGPILAPRREGAARVLVVDRSRSAGSGLEVTNAAREVFRPGDALIVFDSTARDVPAPTADSITPVASQATGSVSPALVLANRTARRLARERDSVAVIIVSPLTTDELDAATAAIRRTWPGSLRLLRAGRPPNDTTAPGRPQARAAPGDPVGVAVELAGPVAAGTRVRLVRDAVTAADTTWARDGRSLVVWPVAAPADWQRRPLVDTVFGVATVGTMPSTVVAPFVRAANPPAGRVVARWSDGEPAVTETTLGTGCIRSVGVAVPTAGDLAITPAFRRFVERMTAPCGDAGRMTPASDSVLAVVLPASIAAPAAGDDSEVSTDEPRRSLVAWMLGLALAAAVAELFVRRGGSHAAA